MAESPSQALRRKRDSSLRVAAELVATARPRPSSRPATPAPPWRSRMFVIGVLRGVDRPAIAAVLPNLRGSRSCSTSAPTSTPSPAPLPVRGHGPRLRARHPRARQPARRAALGRRGGGQGQRAHARRRTTSSRESSLNFVGNVEGRDIYNGRCDVVVTDGFTGNVALKISESLAEMLGAMIKEELMRDMRSKLGAALALPAFARFAERVDYTEMGGAPLLGIDGAAIICHGASPVKAIKNAVRVAEEWAKRRRERAHQGRAGRRSDARRTRRGTRMTRAKIIGRRGLRPQAGPDQRGSREDGRHERRVDRAAQRDPRAAHRRRDRSDIRPRREGGAAGPRARQPRPGGRRLHRGRARPRPT